MTTRLLPASFLLLGLFVLADDARAQHPTVPPVPHLVVPTPDGYALRPDTMPTFRLRPFHPLLPDSTSGPFGLHQDSVDPKIVVAPPAFVDAKILRYRPPAIDEAMIVPSLPPLPHPGAKKYE